MVWVCCSSSPPSLLPLSLARPPAPDEIEPLSWLDRVDIKWKTGDGGWVADEELLG